MDPDVPPTGADRRQQPRRKLPFVRCAIVQSNGCGRMVTIRDLSRGGALLESRVPFEPQSSFALRLVLPGGGGEARLPCELIRTTPANGHAMGLAVRFGEIEPRLAQLIERFVSAKTQSEEEA